VLILHAFAQSFATDTTVESGEGVLVEASECGNEGLGAGTCNPRRPPDQGGLARRVGSHVWLCVCRRREKEAGAGERRECEWG
jgi:hypothetical protein